MVEKSKQFMITVFNVVDCSSVLIVAVYYSYYPTVTVSHSEYMPTRLCPWSRT